MAKRRFKRKHTQAQLQEAAREFSSHLDTRSKLFIMSIEMAVQMNGMELMACKSKEELDKHWDWLENNKEELIKDIASRSDLMMYGDHTGKTKKGTIAKLFNQTAKVIAIMATFNKHGITIFGKNFNFNSSTIKEWINENQVHG